MSEHFHEYSAECEYCKKNNIIEVRDISKIGEYEGRSYHIKFINGKYFDIEDSYYRNLLCDKCYSDEKIKLTIKINYFSKKENELRNSIKSIEKEIEQQNKEIEKIDNEIMKIRRLKNQMIKSRDELK